jgi:hypothetical protein
MKGAEVTIRCGRGFHAKDTFVTVGGIKMEHVKAVLISVIGGEFNVATLEIGGMLLDEVHSYLGEVVFTDDRGDKWAYRLTPMSGQPRPRPGPPIGEG